MYKMIINNNENKVIEFSNFFRRLQRDENKVYFHIDINFINDYSSKSIDDFAYFADQEISSIKVLNNQNEEIFIVTADNTNIYLKDLYENYNDNAKNGSATLEIYYK